MIKNQYWQFIMREGTNSDLTHLLFLSRPPLLRLDTDCLKSFQLRHLFVIAKFIEAQTSYDNCLSTLKPVN
jgi:hypothetical protein